MINDPQYFLSNLRPLMKNGSMFNDCVVVLEEGNVKDC